MSVSGAIKAGRSFVELFCDNAPLIEGLADSYPPLQKFAAIIGKIGAASKGDFSGFEEQIKRVTAASRDAAAAGTSLTSKMAGSADALGEANEKAGLLNKALGMLGKFGGVKASIFGAVGGKVGMALGGPAGWVAGQAIGRVASTRSVADVAHDQIVKPITLPFRLMGGAASAAASVAVLPFKALKFAAVEAASLAAMPFKMIGNAALSVGSAIGKAITYPFTLAKSAALSVGSAIGTGIALPLNALKSAGSGVMNVLAVPLEAIKSAIAPLSGMVDAAGRQLQEWGGQISRLGFKFLAAGAVIKGFLGTALHTFTSMGNEVAKLSQASGLSAEAVSTIGFAARRTGASMDSLEGGMTSLKKVLSGVSEHSAEGRDALAKLGLTVADLQGMSPDEQFRAIAERLSRVADPAQRAAAAMKIFGASASGLMPLFAQGAGGLQALEERARALGIEISGKDAAAARALHEALATLWETVKMVTFAIGAPLAESAREMVEIATTAVAKVSAWVKENAVLVQIASKVSTILTVVGGALVGVGTALSAAGIALVEITAAMGALLSPVALAIAAVAGLGYYFVVYTETGRAALAKLVDTFNEVKADAEKAFGGIADALIAGDLGLAMKVATTLLKLEWAKALNFLSAKWIEFKFAALDIGIDLAAGIASALSTGFAKIQGMWRSLLLKMANEYGKMSKAIGIDLPGLDAIRGAAMGASTGDVEDAERKKQIDAKAAEAKAKNKARHDAEVGDTNTDAEQKAFEDAVKAAAEARAKANKKPDAQEPITADFTTAAEASSEAKKPERAGVTGGVGYEDARTAGGFKSIAAALRQGRDGPEGRMAKSLENVASLNKEMARYQKDIRDKWVNTEVVGFM